MDDTDVVYKVMLVALALQLIISVILWSSQIFNPPPIYFMQWGLETAKPNKRGLGTISIQALQMVDCSERVSLLIDGHVQV